MPMSRLGEIADGLTASFVGCTGAMCHASIAKLWRAAYPQPLPKGGEVNENENGVNENENENENHYNL